MGRRTLNKVFLIGNATEKPFLRQTKNGISVVTFYIITDKQWMKDNELRTATVSHACVAWDKLADICHQVINPGDLVYIEGELDNKIMKHKDSEKEITEVLVSNMKLLSRANEEK